MKANHRFRHPLKPSDGAFPDKNLDFLGEISLEKDFLQRRGNGRDEGSGKRERGKNSIEQSGRNIANLQMWTDHREMARQGGLVRRERWFGAASEFVFGLSGTRDGIDMHAGGNKTDRGERDNECWRTKTPRSRSH